MCSLRKIAGIQFPLPVLRKARRGFRNAIHPLSLLLYLGTSPLAWPACTPPHSIAVKLQARGDAATYAELGLWYANRHQFACAADVFLKSTVMQPDSSRYAYLLGLSLYSAGNARDAIAPLQQSLQLKPDNADTHQTLAAALDQTGNRSGAELQWRLALADHPGGALPLSSLSRDLLADGNYSDIISLLRPIADQGRMPDALAIDLSVAYTRSGLLEEATRVLSATLRVRPSSLPVAEALAGDLMLQSRFQEALRVLSPLAAQHPGDIPTQVFYLHTLVLAHDPRAEPLGRQLLTRDPDQWELLYLMGLLRQEANDYSGAANDFKQSLARNPDYADSHYRLGVALAALKNAPDARQQFEKAIALGSNVPEVHFELAKTLRALGDTHAAQEQLQMYQHGLQAQAGRAQAASQADQGDQAQSSGNLPQAVADYRAAVALDPDEPLLAYKLAIALDKTQDRAAERAALEEAIRLDPRMAVAQNQLGYLDFGDRNTDAAIRHFQLAVQSDPGYTKAWINLAAALCLQSRWPEARDAVHRVLELDPSDRSANALLQQIDSVQAQP